MKKVILALAVVGFFASCDNAGTTADRAKDSLDSITKLQKESVENASDKAQDNLDSINQVKKEVIDSTMKGADTTKKM